MIMPDFNKKTLCHFLKTLLIFFGLVSMLPLAGCKEEELVPFEVTGIDHTDHGEGNKIVSLSINNDRLGLKVGRTTCCIYLPQKWKPGMTLTIRWAAYEADFNRENLTPKPHFAMVEIPRYTRESQVGLYVHMYPGNKAKVLVTRHRMGSIFYPLPREDWSPHEPNLTVMHQYLSSSFTDSSYWNHSDPTKKDLEWAKQWGIVDGKCQDATGKCSYQPYVEFLEKLDEPPKPEILEKSEELEKIERQEELEELEKLLKERELQELRKQQEMQELKKLNSGKE